MTEHTDALERELARDLATLGDRLADADLGGQLYRALANVAWSKEGVGGHLALSWTLAERLVNDLRAGAGREPMTLAQTGGEGEVSATVEAELSRLGWSHRPLDTARHDPDHAGEPQGAPPPRDAGEREAPAGATSTEERFERAHADAEAERARHG